MIKNLDHANQIIAKTMYNLWQASYPIEAAFLNASIFPPLQRSVSDFMACTTEFYGYFFKNRLIAVMEIDSSKRKTHIQSLVVHPNFFRQGIGEQLVLFALDNYDTTSFSVETGYLNDPAISLYKKLGFLETGQYLAAHNIKKIRFEMIR
jgi:ribosomal protein S18 acetylase RimI-like enzyme